MSIVLLAEANKGRSPWFKWKASTPWIAWQWPYVQMLGRGRIRDLTETRTGNAPRHGQDETLMMFKLRSRPMVRTIYCAVNLSVYPEPWPSYQSGLCDRGLHSALASPLFLTCLLTKGTSPAALLLLLLFDINAQSANTNAHSILMFDQRKAVFREMPLVHLIDWWASKMEEDQWGTRTEKWSGNASRHLDNMITGLQ